MSRYRDFTFRMADVQTSPEHHGDPGLHAELHATREPDHRDRVDGDTR